jgi:metal-responsive CopG/Arc/MetJ family transcriptional regulator
MKTAISLDAGLLEEADRTARQMGLSRSRLFSLALQDYLHSRSRQQMLAGLNRVYAGGPDPAERRITSKIKTKFRATIKDRW